MNWTTLGITLGTIAAGLGLYVFGRYYHDAAFSGFSYTLIGGALGYIGGFFHGQTHDAGQR